MTSIWSCVLHLLWATNRARYALCKLRQHPWRIILVAVAVLWVLGYVSDVIQNQHEESSQQEDTQTGGSVCESNAPTTPEVPPAGFEDRNRHRPAYASLSRAINAYACN